MLALLFDDEGLHDDEDAEQRADDDLRPPGGECALEADEGQDDALDQHADEGAGHEGDAACEQRAADDGGGDGVHLHAEAVEVVSCQHDEAVRDAAEGGAEAGDGEDEHLRAKDRQAHERGALLAAADGEDGASEPRVAEDDGRDDDGEVRAEVDLLIDGRDAEILRLLWRVRRDFPAVQEDGAERHVIVVREEDIDLRTVGFQEGLHDLLAFLTRELAGLGAEDVVLARVWRSCHGILEALLAADRDGGADRALEDGDVEMAAAVTRGLVRFLHVFVNLFHVDTPFLWISCGWMLKRSGRRIRRRGVTSIPSVRTRMCSSTK